MSTERISPTAYYTAHVWWKNGLSDPALHTPRGAAYFLALRPMMRVGRVFTRGVGLEEMLLQRHLIIDHLLSTAIESGRVGQVLEIAAGMSGRGLRFTKKYRDRGLIYVEGDLPGMATRKRSRFAASGLARLGHHVVGLDILKDDGPESLLDATRGLFDPSKGIAVITEGLLSYFDTPSTEGVWRRLATFVTPFPDDLYLSDVYLGSRDTVPAIALFMDLLGVFARGRIHTHFQRAKEVAPGLARQGFARTALHRPADWQARLSLPGAGGLEVVHVLEASTRPAHVA